MIRLKNICSCLLLFYCIFLIIPHANAQPTSEAFKINSFTAGNGINWRQRAAFNPKTNEYLVVWSEKIPNKSLDVFYQRLDANTGAKKGAQVQVTFSQNNTSATDGANQCLEANVVYNPDLDQFLLAYKCYLLPAYQNEVLVQRIDGQTGIQIGGSLKVSDSGFTRNLGSKIEEGVGGEVNDPVPVYNSAAKEYLVIWSGNDYYSNPADTTKDHWENGVFAQRINSNPFTEVGSTDFRVAAQYETQGLTTWVQSTSAVYNSINNQYFITWLNYPGGLFARGLKSDGSPITDIFQVDDPNRTVKAKLLPAGLVYNPDRNEFFVAWTQTYYAPGQVDGSTNNEGYEIHAIRINAQNFTKIGTPIPISVTGSPGSNNLHSMFSAAIYNSFRKQYIVVWDSEPNGAYHYLRGQAINSATGERIRNVDFLMTSTASLTSIPGMILFIEPFAAFNSNKEGFLVGFYGREQKETYSNNGIFGQLGDAVTIDNMNTQATPTPTATNTPANKPTLPGEKTGGNDISARITWYKNNPNIFISCNYTGQSPAPQMKLIVYTSANKKLEKNKDKILKQKTLKPSAANASLKVKTNKMNKRSFLIAECQTTERNADSNLKNNTAMVKLSALK